MKKILALLLAALLALALAGCGGTTEPPAPTVQVRKAPQVRPELLLQAPPAPHPPPH